MKKLMFIFAMSFAMINCSERAENVTMNEEKLVENSSNGIFAQADGEPGVVGGFAFDLGTKKHDCLKGFGICKLRAFWITIIDVPSAPDEAQTAEIVAEADGTYSAIYELQDLINEEDTNFYVDEDFTGVDGEDTYIIEQGVYALDSSIGEYGGYVIDVTKL